MLIEAWERLRGYDKWVAAVATVQSTSLSRVDVGTEKSKSPMPVGWESISKISWRDMNQIEHTAEFRAYEESPLYQLIEGDEVRIKYDPANPSEFYLPGLIRSRLARAWKLTLYTLLMMMLGIALLIFLLAH
jgi:hypothetical protein